MDACADPVRYQRSRFTTRLPPDRLYTAAHTWLAREEHGRWRVGFTKFAVRMLGEVVDHGFEVGSGGAIVVGRIMGWIEGFKASTDLYSALSGNFVASNPLLASGGADRVHADPYGAGWLYRATGTPDPAALDVAGYVAVLDRAIDKIKGEYEGDSEQPAAKPYVEDEA